MNSLRILKYSKVGEEFKILILNVVLQILSNYFVL